jgi:hypothetical protein
MPEATFKIGDTFPADDPVARFVTVLAMISNDWQRLAQRMIELDDARPKDDLDKAETGALLIENFPVSGGTPLRSRQISHCRS